MSDSILYLGLDVHKDSVTVAVFDSRGSEPRHLDRLPYDPQRIRRYLQRLGRGGFELRTVYEASGAGYVLHRQMKDWGYHCDLCAPSLVPNVPVSARSTTSSTPFSWPSITEPALSF